MKKEKAFLREKFVEFQLKVADLSHRLSTQEETFQAREKELYLSLFEILDAFENLDENLSAKEADFDKSGRMLAKNIRSIHKKLLRVLRGRRIVKIEFPDNKARMDHCKVIDTKAIHSMENETILSIVKNGYMNKEENAVLRKAEVVTVLNE
ncbi:nucleotide exchange factor GrpE [Desulfonema magnum]|uniref:HSP70 cofactor GrpE domain-containing protein n=1 Tax=Desulfonema magnum TaxID=45655 RepID=A0A975BQJ5_9BACT|nr:nucleotide exchange factor GrpE [Desulfonema magnum]QTA89230.1 HSP70 cofactor GrpE domain-containing protein [Desulfonema magnum]